MGVVVAPTNVTITIRVERIAYTTESYFISYSGVERDMEERQSTTVSGTSDISAINSEYNITLTELEENTTYTYRITAVNCIGKISTAEMNLITPSVGKSSHCPV